MKFFFHPDAERDINEAVDYYEECEKGLGIDFIEELFSGIELVSRYPDAWPPLSRYTRRFLINRFPYGIVYSKIEDEVYIIAVMHLNREPNYWNKRH